MTDNKFAVSIDQSLYDKLTILEKEKKLGKKYGFTIPDVIHYLITEYEERYGVLK